MTTVTPPSLRSPGRSPWRLFVLAGLVLMTLGSVLIGLHAVGFQLRVSGDPSFHARFDATPATASMHVIGGAVVLFTGAFQFWGAIRRRYAQVHRWMGRLYLVFVLVGGTGGLALAFRSEGGLVTHFGFGLLAILWLFSGWQAYAAIRRGDVATHREWMMRNFAMAFGAVTLRIYLGALTASGASFIEAYQTVSWLAWVPNLVIVEWYLALARVRRPATAGGVAAGPNRPAPAA